MSLGNCIQQQSWQDLKDAGLTITYTNGNVKYCSDLGPPATGCQWETTVDSKIASYTSKCDTDTSNCIDNTDENGLIINNWGNFESIDPSNYHRFLCEANGMSIENICCFLS